MSNSLLTLSQITRESVRLFTNENAFLRNINRQYDDQFSRDGAKIGSQLRIRLPNDYVVNTGPAITPQATSEVQTTLTVSTQKNVPLSFTSQDMALSLDDFSERILAPAVNVLAGAVAVDIMQGSLQGSNMVANLSGSTLSTPTTATFLSAGAQLTRNSAPARNRKMFLDPTTRARTVANLAGLFNPQIKISEQYESGLMGKDTLGFDWYEDVTTQVPTTGTYSTATTVSGANQTGNTLVVAALGTGVTLNQGDVITIAGVYAVNRVTKQSTGQLQTFTVTANVASGATSIPIYPAITPPSGSNPVAYQTVTASPASGAAVNLVIAGSGGTLASAEQYRNNFCMYEDAITMATADLPLPPKGIVVGERAQFDGISMRVIQAFDVINDLFVSRLDILYGWTVVRPEWIVRIPDIM